MSTQRNFWNGAWSDRSIRVSRQSCCHADGEADAVGQDLFRLAVVLAPDREAGEVLVGIVDPLSSSDIAIRILLSPG